MSEDFEFKPLTEGLGFHKKTMEIKEDPLTLKASQSALRPQASSPRISKPVQTGIHPQMTTARPEVSRPIEKPTVAPTLNWEPGLPKMEVTSQPRPVRVTRCASNWPSAFFDSAMVLGLLLVFLGIVFATTQVEINYFVAFVQSELGAQVALLALLVSVFQIYTVTCRSFFGKTLGEWCFDCRLGSVESQRRAIYPIQVAWRSLIIALTGFVVLPALSSAIGTDIAGILSGLYIQTES